MDGEAESTETTVEAEPQETEQAAEEQIEKQISDAVDGQASETETGGDEKDSAAEEQGQVEIDPQLFARAIRGGLTEEDVFELGSEAAISRALSLLESRAAPDGARREEKEEKRAEEKKPEVKLPELKLEGFDEVAEPITKAFQSIPAYVQESIAALLGGLNPTEVKQQLGQIGSFIAESQVRSATADVDRWIESQGQDWEKVFGKGTVDDLEPNSEGWKNRDRLVREAKIQEQAFIAAGQRPPSTAKLLERARDVLFRSQVESQARKKVLLKAKNAKGTFVNRPSAKVSAPTEDQAEKKVLDDIKNRIAE